MSIDNSLCKANNKIVTLAGAYLTFSSGACTNNVSHGIHAAINSSVSLQGAPAPVINNNGGWGVLAETGGQVPTASVASYSGNASGTYSGTAASYGYVA